MNKRQKMNEMILQHGIDLKRALFSVENIGPVTLCKALRRLEVKATKVTEAYCNGTVEVAVVDKMEKSVMTSLVGLFGREKVIETGMFINHDPRGYALKVSSEWVKGYAEKGGRFYRDWGGYGILAPDFRE